MLKKYAVLVALITISSVLTFTGSVQATGGICAPADIMELSLGGLTEVQQAGTVAGSTVIVPANEKWVFSDDFTIDATTEIKVLGALVGRQNDDGRGADLTLSAPAVFVTGVVATASGLPGARSPGVMSGSDYSVSSTGGQRGGSMHITGNLLSTSPACLATGDGGDAGNIELLCSTDLTEGYWSLAALGVLTEGIEVSFDGGDGADGGVFVLDSNFDAEDNAGLFYLGNGGDGGAIRAQGYAPPGMASAEGHAGKGGKSGMPMDTSGAVLKTPAISDSFQFGGNGGNGGDAVIDLSWADCATAPTPECTVPYVYFDGILWECGQDGNGDSNIDAGCALSGSAGTDGKNAEDRSSAENGIHIVNGKPGYSGGDGTSASGIGHPGANIGGATGGDGNDGYHSGGDGGSATTQAQCGGSGGNGGNGGNGGAGSCSNLGCDDPGDGGDAGDATDGGNGGDAGDAVGGKGGRGYNGAGGDGGGASATGGSGGNAGKGGQGGYGCHGGSGGISGTVAGSGGGIGSRTVGAGGPGYPNGSAGAQAGGPGSAGQIFSDGFNGASNC